MRLSKENQKLFTQLDRSGKEIYHSFIVYLDEVDALLNTPVSGEDLRAAEAYIMDLLTLLNKGNGKAAYASMYQDALVAYITTCEDYDEDIKRCKNSSTLIRSIAVKEFKQMWYVCNKVQNSIKTIQMTIDWYRTSVSAFKEFGYKSS